MVKTTIVSRWRAVSVDCDLMGVNRISMHNQLVLVLQGLPIDLVFARLRHNPLSLGLGQPILHLGLLHCHFRLLFVNRRTLILGLNYIRVQISCFKSFNQEFPTIKIHLILWGERCC